MVSCPFPIARFYRSEFLKVDMLVMLWRRHRVASEGRVFRHLGADASPQAGFNFLCTRGESMCFTEEIPHFGSNTLLGNFSWTARSLPASTLARGQCPTRPWRSCDAFVWRLARSSGITAHRSYPGCRISRWRDTSAMSQPPSYHEAGDSASELANTSRRSLASWGSSAASFCCPFAWWPQATCTSCSTPSRR